MCVSYNLTTHTHLHNDVKGKVEQQVADGNGQQVGGEVVGSLYEAVGSAGGREERRERVGGQIVQLDRGSKLQIKASLTETS